MNYYLYLYMYLYALPLYFLTLYSVNSQAYDPCGYLGTSSNPDHPDNCLIASPDCCYFAWKYLDYVYYACVSKRKLVDLNISKNLSMAFISYIYDDDMAAYMKSAIYSKCNDNRGVITSPSDQSPPE
jgi:hypothetical protein